MTAGRRCVCVVDDEAAVRRGLARLLSGAGFEVRSYESAREYLDDEPPSAPCCLVLDLRMPDLDGLALQEELAGRPTSPAIVFLSGHGDVPHSVRAMKAGAVDFLEKPADPGTLIAAVERALARNESRRAEAEELAELRARRASLTPREDEVFQRVVVGLLNKQIGFDLGIAEKTVKVHRGRVMSKMAATSVADLARMAEKLGVASKPLSGR